MKYFLNVSTTLLFLLTPLLGSPVWANDDQHDAIDNHSSGFVFSRTDKEEFRWIDRDSTGGLGNIWIDQACAQRLGPPQAAGTWSDLIALSPGFDPGFGGDALSPALGQWEKTGQGTGVAKYQKLAFNQQGQLSTVYTGNVTVSAETDGTLAGTLSIEARIPGGEGAPVFSGLPFTATRIAP